MKSENPLVSICVPTYNSARYIRQSLDSVLAQSYKNLEIIVSDNASTDGTIAILQEYADKHKIRLYLNEVNIGAGANFNKLISLATGEYVAIYHSDDLYEKTMVEESVKLLNEDESVGLVGTMANVIDAGGNLLHHYDLPEEIKRLNKSVYTFDEALSGVLNSGRNRIFFVTPSLMLRTRIFNEISPFNQAKYSSACDTELWLRIATKYNVAVIDKKLMNYRIHEAQGSELELRKNIEKPDIIKVIAEYRNYINNRKLEALCDCYIDRLFLITALRQNYTGQFTKSNETLRVIKTARYKFYKQILKMANALEINLRIRPRSFKP